MPSENMSSVCQLLLSTAIGWVLGNFMTAQVIALKKTGKGAAHIGRTGNPGMANIMASLGFKSGIAVLGGDILKTAAAMAVCGLLFPSAAGEFIRPALTANGGPFGSVAAFWAGMGAVLGHNFPFLSGRILSRKYGDCSFCRGGKGVTATCAALILFSPVWGLLSAIAGMLTVFATKYLCAGAVVIPAAFCLPAFLIYGPRIGWPAVFLTILMFNRHYPALKLIPSGKAHKDDVPEMIKRKLRK